MRDDVRKFVARSVGRSPDDVLEQWADYANDCQVFRLAGTERVRITNTVLRRYCPAPDPFVEAFTAVAVALHDAKKRRERRVADRERQVADWT